MRNILISILTIINLFCACPLEGMDIFSRKFNSENGLPDNNVRNIIQDSKGFIWMGTPGGLYRFDNYFYTTYKYSESGNTKLLNNNHISGLYRLPDDRLLIVELGGKLSIFDVNSNRFVDLPARKKQHVYDSVRTTKTDMQALAQFKTVIDNGGNVINDNLGNMVVVDTTGLIWFIDRNTREVIKMRVFDKDLFPLVNSKKYKIVTSRKNNLIWVSTNGCGITVYDRKTQTARHIRHDSGLISSDFIIDMCMDRNEDVWVDDEFNGAVCLTVQDNDTAVKLLNPHAGNQRANQVYVMRWMPDSTLFIANTFADVYKTDHRMHIPPRPTISGLDVHSICSDINGNTWIGTRQEGILAKGRKWLRHDPKDSRTVSANNILHMLCDSKGRIWVAAAEAHLDLVTTNNDGTITFRHFFGENFSPRVMLQDKAGAIWVGAESGLYRFYPDELIKNSNAFTRIIPAADLAHCDVCCIFEDTNGHIYIGTAGNGAYRIDDTKSIGKQNKKWQITPIKGLISNDVRSMIEDDLGVIWMGTNKGITCYDPRDGKIWYRYNEYDPVQNFYADNCVCRLPDGKLAFGTNRGIVIYDPTRAANENGTANRLTITDILINGVSAGLMGNDSPIDGAPDNEEAITLPYNRNSLTIRFSMFNFKSAMGTRYSYYLEGYDKGWSEPSAYSFASYKNLPPGRYIFMVRAHDNGPRPSEERQMVITIRQPWWSTWWACAIYMALAAIVGTAVFRQLRTVYRLRQRIAIENKLTEYKLQTFTNISHEFRTPLTIIRGAMQSIGNQDIPAGMQQPISNMQKSVNRMMRLVNQLLEFRKMQNNKLRLALEETDVVKFIKEIFFSFKDIAENKRINYMFIPQEKSRMVFVDKGHLDKIAYNLLSNAFKYTPCQGEITVRLGFKDNKMIIRVEDNGVGIPKEKQPELFQRFMQSTFSNDSIGIGLNLTKALVEVHKGSISFMPNVPKGSIFTVELPTDKGVYCEEDFMAPGHLLLEHAQEGNGRAYHELAAQPMNDRKVLIVEDDADVMEYLRETMQRIFTVHTAMDGIEALHTLEDLQADLIISDIMMPLMDGLEFTARVRNNENIKDVPIILLTALTSDDKRIKGLKNGADAYITKPFDPELLITTAVSLIEKNDRLKEQYTKKSAQQKAILPLIITDERDKRLLDSVDMWIDGHLCDPMLSVDEVAKAMGYSRTHFFKKMKALTGQPPADYIKAKRLDKAAQLLKDETTTVAEVCYKVGISKPNYFAKIFKERFGISPKKYQQGG